MHEIIEALTRPWEREKIKWRVGSLTKDKKRALPLAYVDARSVMERLDTTVGPLNWQDRYEFHDKRTVCYLSLRFGDEWISKADGAGDSDIEGEKGGISDAFKRAAVRWGIGRELYAIKCRWMPCDEYKQLIGDPWQHVITGAAEEKLLAKDERVKKARGYVEEYIKELAACNNNDLEILTTKHRQGLARIHSNYPELSEIINNAITTKLERGNG